MPWLRTVSHSSEIQTRDGVWCTEISEEEVIKIQDREGPIRNIKHHAIEIVSIHQGSEHTKTFYPKGDEEVTINIYTAQDKTPVPALTIVCGLAGLTPVTIVTPLGEVNFNGSLHIT